MSETGEQTTVLGRILGGVLVVVGIGAYVISGFASATALIPSVFGVLIAALSLLGGDDTPDTAIYGIGLLAVLGLVGSMRGVPEIVALVTGGSADAPVAAVTQGVMILVCLVLVGAVGRHVREAL